MLLIIAGTLMVISGVVRLAADWRKVNPERSLAWPFFQIASGVLLFGVAWFLNNPPPSD